MSLVVVPVCYGCKTAANLSLSCTDCLRIYCGSCFGLQQPNEEQSVQSFSALVALLSVRVCSNCTTNEEPEVIEPESSTPVDIKPNLSELVVSTVPPVEVKEERCWSHGKEMNLFCLTCNMIICGDCFLNGAIHMRHQIDFLDTVFREKRVETQLKLSRLEKRVGALQQEAIHCETNLALIQSAEKAVLAEIDAICEEAKMSVARMTINRKRKLEARAGFPSKKKKLTASLQKMIDQMGPSEFFQQQPAVYKQCDELMADCLPKGFQDLKFEDVGCELVPPYEMQKFTLSNFDGTSTGWPQHLNTSCDTMWNVFLRKKESLFVKVTPDEPEASKYPYKLLVQIRHPMDIRKSITKSFTVHGTAKEHEIVTIDQLKAEKFIRDNNELVVNIGLRPLNAITENRFLKNRYKTLTTTIAEMEKQLTVSGKDIDCKYCIMYFSIYLSKVPKKDPKPIHSPELTDQMERQWCLRVYPFALTQQENNLKLFMVLRKGTRSKCRYFIELLHDDPAKNVIQCTESSFDTVDAGYGWHSFMERKQLLADPGFYPKSVLRFRFGVQPIDS